MKKLFQPNIGKTGRILRAIMGLVLLGAAAALSCRRTKLARGVRPARRAVQSASTATAGLADLLPSRSPLVRSSRRASLVVAGRLAPRNSPAATQTHPRGLMAFACLRAHTFHSGRWKNFPRTDARVRSVLRRNLCHRPSFPAGLRRLSNADPSWGRSSTSVAPIDLSTSR